MPDNFYGTWAKTAEDCGSRNHYRFTIDQSGLDLFEGEIELQQLTDHDLTRITGDFTYYLNKEGQANGLPYQVTLELREDGNVLIRQDAGQGAPEGEMRYVRCNN